jgi:hypothetical protein
MKRYSIMNKRDWQTCRGQRFHANASVERGNRKHTREKRKETGNEHLIDTMVPSSASRRAVLYTVLYMHATSSNGDLGGAGDGG